MLWGKKKKNNHGSCFPARQNKTKPLFIDKEMRNRCIYPRCGVCGQTGFLKSLGNALATQFTASYCPLPLLALTFWFSSCPFDSFGAGFCLPQAIRYLAHAEHAFKLFSSVSRAQHGNITLALQREKKIISKYLWHRATESN